ncbi:MAG: tRNA pseudouridine(55) synthase TruB [Ruminococcaceae bacterium]|nr:tRNA pseudouridine(55) synthase TruB [Oscillospiraceae bacterium]
MANGIIIVDKPAGWTSHDVVAKLRGALHEKRIGHGGTLDPMATGVLPVFVGRATRAVEFFEAADKAYETLLQLGTVTDTDDITGAVLEEKSVSVTEEALRATLPRFLGQQEQLPPMYSAIKVDGKKLYELARAGKTVERKTRTITIHALELLGFDGKNVRLHVCCSKGTYIRTLCHDIGEALGCGGTMAALRRTQAGAYSLSDATPLEAILFSEDPAALLRPVDSMFSEHPKVVIFGEQVRRCYNGNDVSCPESPNGTVRVYDENGTFLMLGRAKNGTIHTIKSFFEVR